MAKKDWFLIVDTETTQGSLVADFGAIVVDRKGNIAKECAILINGIFNAVDKNPDNCLFWSDDSAQIWKKKNLENRYAAYNNMLNGGTRMLASVAAINRWLDRVKETYNPYLTAYNLAFDANKCANTGIDLAQFDNRFCLWYAAFSKWAFTKQYREFALQLHAFNPPTELGNMTFKTNAETMARFVTGNPRLEDEPHTSIEDIKYYELPILLKLINSTKKQDWLNPQAYDWNKLQVKNWYTAK